MECLARHICSQPTNSAAKIWMETLIKNQYKGLKMEDRLRLQGALRQKLKQKCNQVLDDRRNNKRMQTV